jgi:hypothetical protein
MDPWFETRNAKYKFLKPWDSYAPLPVFFEGWKSKGEIARYTWDFGDGTIETNPYQFNAAHVYETPGTYTCSLTVEDAEGNTNAATFEVKVREPNGRTFYVDSESGSDMNPGNEELPWKSATKAFRGMVNHFYRAGDRVLFKRGQTFEVEGGQVMPRHGRAGFGYSFGAYGEGEKPLLQRTGGGRILNLSGNGLGYFSLSDLRIRMESDPGDRGGEFLFSTQDISQIMFLRVEAEAFSRFAVFSQGTGASDDANRAAGVFFMDCSFVDSQASHIYAKASYLAIKNCRFDYSGNHIAYLGYVNGGLIQDSIFTRPAWGRAALRLSGDSNDFDVPTQNVAVVGNTMEGWIDPRKIDPNDRRGTRQYANGTRYNFRLVDLSPNAPNKQRMQNVVFAQNRVKDAETLLGIGAYDDLLVAENVFTTEDTSVNQARILVGDDAERKPLRDVTIRNNWFSQAPGSSVAMIKVMPFSQPKGAFGAQHQRLRIVDNTIVSPNGSAYVLGADTAGLRLALKEVDRNTIYTDQPKLVRVSGGEHLDLEGWRKKDHGEASTVAPAADAPPTPDRVFP